MLMLGLNYSIFFLFCCCTGIGISCSFGGLVLGVLGNEVRISRSSRLISLSSNCKLGSLVIVVCVIQHPKNTYKQ